MIQLIKGQTVSIDNHDRGSGQPISYDYRIHIHKRMNDKKHLGIEVYLYLSGDKEMLIKNKNRRKSDIAGLEHEMKKAFENPKKRTAFVKSMLDELNRKCTYSSTKERLEANISSTRNLAKLFGLHEIYKQPLKDDEDVFETSYNDDEGNEYFILRDFKGNTIRIGDSKDLVENWDSLFAK